MIILVKVGVSIIIEHAGNERKKTCVIIKDCIPYCLYCVKLRGGNDIFADFTI